MGKAPFGDTKTRDKEVGRREVVVTESELKQMYRYVRAKLEFLSARLMVVDRGLRLQLEREWRERCVGALPPLEGGPWAGDAEEQPREVRSGSPLPGQVGLFTGDDRG